MLTSDVKVDSSANGKVPILKTPLGQSMHQTERPALQAPAADSLCPEGPSIDFTIPLTPNLFGDSLNRLPGGGDGLHAATPRGLWTDR